MLMDVVFVLQVALSRLDVYRNTMGRCKEVERVPTRFHLAIDFEDWQDKGR